MKNRGKGQRKNKKASGIRGFLAGIFFGLFIGVYSIINLNTGKWTVITLIEFILSIYIAVFITINIHEFGHFIFGKLYGYKLISYRVGIFTWSNRNGKMKFSIIKNKGYGGLCAMIPPKQDGAAYKKTLFYAGGIILNIVTCVVFIGIPYMFPDINEKAKLFLNVLGFIGLVLAFINFLPFVAQNNLTDGKIIWSIILKKPFARKLMEINKISSQLGAGIRPRDLQINLIPDIGSKPVITDILIDLYYYFKALDNNNQEDIIHYSSLFEENIETIPHHSLPAFYYEICYVASVTGDEGKAREYHEKAGKILKKDKDINGLRVKAYYEYYINKDSEIAALQCVEALAVADLFPIKGQGLMEKALVKHLMELIENE